MLKKILLAVFSFCFVSLLSCSTGNTITDPDEDFIDNPNVKFNIIARGHYSNISLANQLVIRNTKDWQQLLKINGDASLTTLPAINFDEQFVIAVYAGQQPSGGYAVEVTNIKRLDDNLFVSVALTEPEKNENVSLVLTQPYIIVATQSVDGKVIFLANTK